MLVLLRRKEGWHLIYMYAVLRKSGSERKEGKRWEMKESGADSSF
jgi:hypothetical protein